MSIEQITLVLNLLLNTCVMAVLVWYALAVTGSSWQFLAVPGSFPDTSEGSSPNAGMVVAVKVIGSYWQLLAVNGS